MRVEGELGGDKGRREENRRVWEGQDRGRTEMESKVRCILIERAIMGLSRNLTLGKLQGIHKDDPS